MFIVRDVPESDFDQVYELNDIAFHERTKEDDRDSTDWLFRRAHRIGAYEDGRLIGFLAALPMHISIPGGATLPCLGVTYVCVLPTHTRRGVLTAILDRMWADRAEPLAALYVSKARIYGRHGFAAATHALHVDLDGDRPLELRVEPAEVPLRLVPPDGAHKVLAPLYERAMARRAGQFARDTEWWERAVLPDEDPNDDGLGAPRVVVAGDSGYAVYRTKGEDTASDAPALVYVVELEADSAQVEAALWRYLASIGLTWRVGSLARPVDDLLPLLVADGDVVTVKKRWPALWLRLSDVPAALSGRGYAAPVDLVLDIADERLPANHGRFRLTVAAGGHAGCGRTDDRADLSLHVRDLAAAYLGDTPVSTLVRAGLVTEHTPGAARRLDAALHTPLAPFTADEF
ncbi:Predicted acetyltransferase [Sinosporangium album]|uniref:Predicted acetyltransferase n=1 Tax=Sinosporangium album TaxID=504805 RepID=A0A1G7X762_9ACTN|nr:GNAT family N-acetyltransferase [Sinosporangium album]SDG79995.1 Predicted acetyltransferase [Sinosporangium album]